MERLDGDLLPKELVSHVLLSVSKKGCLWKLLGETSSLERLHRILARVLRWKSVAGLREHKKQPPTAAEMATAKTKWVLWVQQEMYGDLEEPTTTAVLESSRRADDVKSCSQVLQSEGKVPGKFLEGKEQDAVPGKFPR